MNCCLYYHRQPQAAYDNMIRGYMIRGYDPGVEAGRRLPVPPEGLVCATKLHGAKIDGPAVAGLFFRDKVAN